ncbi:MAG: MBL fold metallo-hydrolase [Planctomycetota bacterium]
MARVIVLGSGTGVPTERRSSPGLLVETDKNQGCVILIDPGPGALSRMARAGFPVQAVDRVLITHFHPDHTMDIMSLLFARRNPGVAACAGPLTLTGPVGTKALVANMKNLYGKSMETHEGTLMIVEADEGALPPASGLQGTAWRMEHSPGALGYKLSVGSGTLAVSGDTGPCEALVHLGTGADLFFIECAFPDHEAVEGHMTPSHIGRLAQKADPGQIVLYHLYPSVDEEEALACIRFFFSGPLCIAEDGAEFTL